MNHGRLASAVRCNLGVIGPFDCLASIDHHSRYLSTQKDKYVGGGDLSCEKSPHLINKTVFDDSFPVFGRSLVTKRAFSGAEGFWKIHRKPASTGGSSSRLQSGSETLSIAVLPKVNWTSICLRMNRRVAGEGHLDSGSLRLRLLFLEVFQQSQPPTMPNIQPADSALRPLDTSGFAAILSPSVSRMCPDAASWGIQTRG
jgi:hypothetical protein